jgi:hypothetical protein
MPDFLKFLFNVTFPIHGKEINLFISPCFKIMYFIISNYRYSIWNRNDENKIACSIAAICNTNQGRMQEGCTDLKIVFCKQRKSYGNLNTGNRVELTREVLQHSDGVRLRKRSV